MERLNFTRLRKRVLILGVPTMMLFLEVGALVVFIFIVKLKWWITILLIVGMHLAVASLFKFSKNPLNEISFLFGLPYRRFYKEGACFLPSVYEVRNRE